MLNQYRRNVEVFCAILAMAERMEPNDVNIRQPGYTRIEDLVNCKRVCLNTPSWHFIQQTILFLTRLTG